MKPLQQRTWWVSLILMLSLLTQTLLPPAAIVAREATSPPQAAAPTAQRSLAGQANELEQSLTQLEAATDDASFRAARSRVQLAWGELLMVERAVSTELAATEQELGSRGLSVARGRQATRRAEHGRQFNGLKGKYQALSNAGADRGAAKGAAAALRAALRESLKASKAAPPKLDLLPTRPAPQSRPVERRAALNPRASQSGQLADQPVYSTAAESTAAVEDTGSTVTAIGAPPVAADRASTEDATITPEIQALADQLGRNPTKIYEYVRNKIAFEPYYGSRKGALLTLWERSGNDIDTASLLIALLRASGFSARYVQGTVAIDETRARNWVGNAPSLQVAGNILATGGVPVGLTADGYLVKEHVWAEVYDPNKTFVDFNGNGRVDVADIQTVARQFNTTLPTYDFDGDGTVDVDDVNFVAARWKQTVQNGGWVELDASFKQFTYHQPMDLKALTGFDAEQWVDQASRVATVNDTQESIGDLPRVPSPNEPEDNDADLPFADRKVEQAAAATQAYIEAHPELTNVDLLGGAYIVAEAVTALPTELPTLVLADEPVSEYSQVPAARRNYVTVQLYDEYGGLDLSYKASYPSLANRRVTISYQAATAADQAVIDSYGGALLTTPPVVDLVPVLRINGTEVARGSAAPMGEQQTRSLTFTDANGRNSTVQNGIAVGETFAVGLAYGRTSKEAIEASQARLAAARNALPKNASGDPDTNAPGNMAEPVIGEMLHLSLQAYFSQLDTLSEVVARGRNVRWFRYLSAGTAIQDLVFGYCFGGPCQTRGGGQTFDIQQNVVSNLSLAHRPADERAFLQTTGYFGSALEHSIFGNLGQGAVSSIQLLEMALSRHIPVYRISTANKAAVFPLLQLDASTESIISAEIDQGKVVTVSQRPIAVNDWSGVGYIIMDPSSGAAAYMISGGLFGETSTMNGGSLWDILKTIGAYAWLAINMGLDLMGIWGGILLLLTPDPTLLTKAAGIALIVANLAALGFDIADLWGLVNGSKSEQEYIGEQLTGLIINAMLKRLGIAAAARIAKELGEDAIPRIMRQLDDLTDGAVSRLLGSCTASTGRVPGLASPLLASCPGFTPDEILLATEKLGISETGWKALADVADAYNARGVDGAAMVRGLLNNAIITRQGADVIEAVAKDMMSAPRRGPLDPDKIINAMLNNGNLGHAYELRRAIALDVPPGTVTGYGERINQTFQRLDKNGNPIPGRIDTQPLEGDIVLQGSDPSKKVYVDAKHGDQSASEERIWNQVQKAAEAIKNGDIEAYRFEVSGRMPQVYKDYIASLIAADPSLAGRLTILDNLGDGYR